MISRHKDLLNGSPRIPAVLNAENMSKYVRGQGVEQPTKDFLIS
jgi:hypothetical protein